ncbi:hypothetical protein VPH35_137077 [Triticum aestivum]
MLHLPPKSANTQEQPVVRYMILLLFLYNSRGCVQVLSAIFMVANMCLVSQLHREMLMMPPLWHEGHFFLSFHIFVVLVTSISVVDYKVVVSHNAKVRMSSSAFSG